MLGLGKILKRFSGRHYRRFLRTCSPIVKKINAWEVSYQKLSDEELAAKTEEFRKRYQAGESLDSLLPEAFAAVKNAARRLCGKTVEVCGQPQTWDMVHYDVQLIGGIALHSKKIAEMATGEGKTLVATLPLYLNALTGKNCQLVTVNDYLARRDSELMGNIYHFLGLTVGCIQNAMNSEQRRAAYACDITYGTASEFGFDYLRDNGLAMSENDQVQRDHYFCIVDEIDSVLIDEARTPLIISGPAEEERPAPYHELKPLVEKLVHLQNLLCNRLVSEAKKLLDEDLHSEEGLKKLYQVYLGNPRHKQLMKLLEEGALPKVFEKFVTEMSGELRREDRYAWKEELYFTIDERQNNADLTEIGRQTLYPQNPNAFLLPDLTNRFSDIDRDDTLSTEQKLQQKQQAEIEAREIGERIHCISQLLKAYTLFERDRHYIVHQGQIVIVDPNTGRAMPGRRWSDGLHQAVESKENLEIQKENKTYATVTIQNYFRMYDKLAGMTGTAETEAQEFYDIYHLSVVTIPTHKPCIRIDEDDVIYKTRREKYQAVVADIQEAHAKGQPVLVGTTSVEASELLSKILQNLHLPHTVLNAKFHEAEAQIVAKAGQIGAITIATNMAGRGTDIKLGEGVDALGGLKVLGTERHESRRIDRQLRGRCARQGDPGSSKFFISLEDDLMRLFASRGPIAALLDRTFKEGDVLTHPMLNRSIASAQKKVEQQNYSIRKRLLQYDDVLNVQREVIYSLRTEMLSDPEPLHIIMDLIEEELQSMLSSANSLEVLIAQVNQIFPIQVKLEEVKTLPSESIVPLLIEKIRNAYAIKQQIENPAQLQMMERLILLRSLDRNWQNHLTEMDDLRQSVALRSYAQKNPLYEYKAEAFHQFEEILHHLRRDVAFALFRSASSADAFKLMIERIKSVQQNRQEVVPTETSATTKSNTVPQRKVDDAKRNEPCPCGSGKKYKKCCGKNS